MRALMAAGAAAMALSACGQDQAAPAGAVVTSPAESVSMGGAKSVTTFFITSRGSGRGGDLGGLDGADAHCQALAMAQGAGDHTWRAYLSAPGVDARDRIGSGPWYNAEGELVAESLAELHGEAARLTKATALTEAAAPVNGRGDSPNQHDILTGSLADGTLAGESLTCNGWTSGAAGMAQVGHHDRQGGGQAPTSWNSAHASAGCSQTALEGTGGSGLFYCFAID